MYFDKLNGISPSEILLYLRKSRTDDPLQSVEETLKRHETVLDEWCERNLNALIPEENRYREIVSGETIKDRPEIQTILKLIESPKYKAVLVVEVQRISRGDLEEAGRITKLFRYSNTLIITPQKIYDLIDEYDRDIFERELKRGNDYLEYVKKILNRGRQLSVLEGNYIGSVPPYGYEKIMLQDENKKKSPSLKVKEEEAVIVRKIFDMYVNQNMGCTSICNYLDNLKIPPPKGTYWSPSALYDLLKNVHYIGMVRWNRRKNITVVENGIIVKHRPKNNTDDTVVVKGKHEAIISEELFEAAKAKHGNSRVKSRSKVRNPLSGLLYCSCGRAMSYRTYNRDGKSRSAPRLLCDGQTKCHTPSCTFDGMMETLNQALKSTLADFEVKIKSEGDKSQDHELMIKQLEKRLEELEQRELAQWESQSDPNPAKRMPTYIFAKLNKKILDEKRELIEAISSARKLAPKTVDYAERIGTFTEAVNAINNKDISAEQKNILLKNCIKKITYTSQPSKKRNATPIIVDIDLNI